MGGISKFIEESRNEEGQEKLTNYTRKQTSEMFKALPEEPFNDVSDGATASFDDQSSLLVNRNSSTREGEGEKLQDDKRLLNDVFNAVTEGISILDKELNIIKVNQFMKTMYPTSIPLVGKKCYQVYQQRESPCPWCPSLSAMESGETRTATVPYPSDVEPERWLTLSSFPIKDAAGNITGVIEYVRDITEQKKNEDALEFERKQMLSIFDSMEGIIYVADPETYEILYVNSKLQKIFNKKLVGETCYKVLQNKDAPCEFCTNHIIFKDENKGKPYKWEFHNPRSDRDYIITDRAIKWPDGRDVRFELAVDITETKQAENILKLNEERYRSLFENMSSGVAVYEAVDNGNDFIFKDFNKAGEKIEGVKRKDIIGKPVTEAFPGVKEIGLFDVFQRVFKTGKSEHHPISLYKDDKIIGWRENYVYKLPSGEIVAIYTDVTEKKKAEEKLKAADKEWNLTFNAISDLISVQDKNFNLIKVNETYAKMFDKEPDDLIGKHCYELVHGTKEPIPDCPYRKTLETNKPSSTEFFEPHLGIHLGVTAYPIYDDEKGEVYRYVIIAKNITERKKIEETLKQKLDDLEAFHDAAVDRELKMIEYEKEINKLCEKLGEKPRYNLAGLS